VDRYRCDDYSVCDQARAQNSKGDFMTILFILFVAIVSICGAAAVLILADLYIHRDIEDEGDEFMTPAKH
jgi:hypothetical protein